MLIQQPKTAKEAQVAIRKLPTGIPLIQKRGCEPNQDIGDQHVSIDARLGQQPIAMTKTMRAAALAAKSGLRYSFQTSVPETVQVSSMRRRAGISKVGIGGPAQRLGSNFGINVITKHFQRIGLRDHPMQLGNIAAIVFMSHHLSAQRWAIAQFRIQTEDARFLRLRVRGQRRVDILASDPAGGQQRAEPSLAQVRLSAKDLPSLTNGFVKRQMFKRVQRVVMHEHFDRPLSGKQMCRVSDHFSNAVIHRIRFASVGKIVHG